MKHKCGHEIDIERTKVKRLSDDPALNQLLMETTLSTIPCFECLCEEYKRYCWFKCNDDGSDIIIHDVPRVKGGTHRQGAFAHLIRHVLCCSGEAKFNDFADFSGWIDHWNKLTKPPSPEVSIDEVI